MIFSSVSDAPANVLAGERFAAALAFLGRDDLGELPCGRHDILGDEVFANVMSLTTVPAAEKDFEAHRRYHDIHCVIEGTELIGVAPVERCRPKGEFSEADDFGLYTDPARETWVTLVAGDLLVTPPADAHKPGCCADAPAPLRKVCVKVLA